MSWEVNELLPSLRIFSQRNAASPSLVHSSRCQTDVRAHCAVALSSVPAATKAFMWMLWKGVSLKALSHGRDLTPPHWYKFSSHAAVC